MSAAQRNNELLIIFVTSRPVFPETAGCFAEQIVIALGKVSLRLQFSIRSLFHL